MDDPQEEAECHRWIADELKRSLHALASPPAIQSSLFAGACLPCELTFDFTHFKSAHVGNYPDQVTAEQRAALGAVQSCIDTLVDGTDYECWNVGVLSGAHGRARLEAAPHTHLLPSVASLSSLWPALGARRREESAAE